MALVGHISGSQQSNSLIAVSGTVIVANRPDALFPATLPGADVSFFVSGSRGGKGNAAERTVSVFGGDAVVSGSLTIGTGSITITSNDVQFGSFTNRIELNGSNITFFDGANPTGKTLTSLAAAAAAGNNTEVQYNNGGSLAGASTFTFNSSENRLTVSQAAIPTALTASTLKAGGSTVNLFDDTATTINFGAGASTAFNIGPSAGVTTISGDLKVGGNDIIASDNQTNITMTSNTLTTFAGDIKVGGNDIQSSGGMAAITLSSADVEVKGDLTVTGNDIKSSGGTTAITLSGANVIIPGDLTVNGTTITADVTTVTVEDPIMALGFTSGSVAVTAGDRGWIGGLSGADNAAMIWDQSASEFVVARTTETGTDNDISISSYAPFRAGNILGAIVSASLGFSGSHTKLMDGTSAFVAGSGIAISSASNGAVTITSTVTATPGGSNTHVQFNDGGSFGGSATFTFDKTGGAMGAGKLSVNEALATALTSSTLVAGGATVNVFNATATTLNVGGAATSITMGDSTTATTTVRGGTLVGNTATQNLFNTTATTLNVGGAATSITMGDSTTATTTVRGGTLVGNTATQNLFNTTATTLNVGGAATTILVGASAVAMAVGGVNSPSSTITAATGSFGSVLASSTSTFTGQTTHNGGISTTTLGASGAATLSSTLTVTGAATLNGDVDLGDAITDTITFTGRIDSDVLPITDRLYNLGSAEKRWNNIFTGDLHLRNERGNWTVIEEETYLSIRNNNTGKMYKFVLEEVGDSEE